MLSRDDYLDRWSQLHGGYDPRASPWARGWLALTYACARPLVRVPPDALTAVGVLVTIGVLPLAAAGGRWPLLAVLVVVLSGLLDNLDGCVAVVTGRESRWGYVLDSLADRACDALYLIALWLLGAPGWLCVLAGALTWWQEYARARAGNAGMGEIGVATVWERPSRVIVTAFGLAAAGAWPERAADLATVVAAVSAGLAVVAIAQLLVVVRRTLRR